MGGMAIINAIEKKKCGGDSPAPTPTPTQMQDIVVNISPEGSSSRLFGMLLDTLGGTYRLELDNCRLLSVAEQDEAEYDDDCDGVSIPSVVVPLATVAEIVGGSHIDEDMYDMKALLSIIEQYKFSFMSIVAGGSMFVQSGSLLTFCVEPLDSSRLCQLRFVKLQENGREYNMKRYERVFVTDEYDVSGGGNYRIVVGDLESGESIYAVVDGVELLPDEEGVITGTISPSSIVIMCHRQRQKPLLFALRNKKKEGYMPIRALTCPLTEDLVRYINESQQTFESIDQINGFDSQLPQIDRLDIVNNDGKYPISIKARVSNFNIDGSFGDIDLELHDLDSTRGCIYGNYEHSLKIRGEYPNEIAIGNFFKSIDIAPDLPFHINTEDFDGDERALVVAEGGYCRIVTPIVDIDNQDRPQIDIFADDGAETTFEFEGVGAFSLVNFSNIIVKRYGNGGLEIRQPFGNKINKLHLELDSFYGFDLEGNNGVSCHYLYFATKDSCDLGYKEILRKIIDNGSLNNLCYLHLNRCEDGDNAQWKSWIYYFIQSVSATVADARKGNYDRLLDFSDFDYLWSDPEEVRAEQLYTEAKSLSQQITPNADGTSSDYWTIHLPHKIKLYKGEEIVE